MTDVTAETPPDDDSPLTFQAYADRIGKSRPYVSKLVNERGVIHGPALTPDRKIIPAIADRQRAEAADPGRTRHGAPAESTSPAHTPAFATARTRKIQADADAAELDLDIRRGRYIERATAGPAIAGFFREIRDAVILAIREYPDRPEDAVADVFADKAATLPHVLTEGAPPPG